MTESIRGDVVTKQEMKQRGIRMIPGKFGGMELRAPTYDDTISHILQERGFIEDKHITAACDYLELKNSVYGFLNAKTISFILQMGDASLKRSHAESAYYVAAKYIGPNTERVVVRALNSPADRTLEIIEAIEAYRNCFLTVLDGMELAISAVRAEMEKEFAI